MSELGLTDLFELISKSDNIDGSAGTSRKFPDGLPDTLREVCDLIGNPDQRFYIRTAAPEGSTDPIVVEIFPVAGMKMPDSQVEVYMFDRFMNLLGSSVSISLSISNEIDGVWELSLGAYQFKKTN